MYHDMFWGGMWFSWIFWIIVIAFIAWLVVSMVNRSQKNINPDNESPIDILKKRYVKGEIDKEEFEEKKRDLSN